MLRSIAYQLVKKDDTLFDQFFNTFRDKHIISQGREWEWQPRELKKFITSVIIGWKSKPLLLLVDALDECNKVDMDDAVKFLESLSIHANKSGTTLRICLSRRHYPHSRIAKSLELIVENNEDHREDIATYIRAKLVKRDAGIEAEIKKKANGIFMWVVLVVELLNKAIFKVRGKKKAMQDALEKIPGELEEVFRVMFNEDDGDMAETVLMLQWVLFTQRPLTPVELYAAVEAGDTGLWSQSSDIDHDSIQQSIEHLSKGLIEIRSGVGATVQFIHLSVNDFLLRNKRLQTLDQALEPDPVTTSHRRLWACCWSHIRQVSSTGTKEAYKELLRNYPFLRYAADHILDHAEKILDEGAVRQASVTIEKWLRDGSSWFEWWKNFLSATRAPVEHAYLADNMDAGLLYMLSLRGYKSLVKCMLAEDSEEGVEVAEVNAQGGQYGNALQAASARGELRIVELLLKAGADVNAQGGEYGNALQAASARGKQQIVELLLKTGADVNAQGSYGNALQAASAEGEQQIAELLLKAGVDVDAQGSYGNALHAASLQGEQQIVELLLKAGADVNAQGGEYGNALQAASVQGEQQIIELLLKAGADVNAQGGEYGNALQAASLGGKQQIVELLLKAGADVNAQGGEYGNALQAARDQQIAELLLKAGADVNAQGSYFGNALQAASWRGKQQIVELLLKAGADVNTQGGEYGNALQAASAGGKQQIVELLLKAGVDVNIQGGYYGNALQAASAEGKQQIVELLLKAGADVNAQGSYGNALHAALSRGKQQIVELRLINGGIDVNTRGIDVDTQGGEYGNALQAASAERKQRVVELLLLKLGVNVNTQCGYYGNALQAASAEGKQQIVELLLKADTDVNAQGGEYGNVLQAALWREKQQIVELLLKAGADVNAQGGEYGNTFGKAPQAALHQKHHGITSMLRKAGATAIVQHTESGVVNTGIPDTEGVSVEERHEGTLPEAAPAMASPSTEAPSPRIWFPLRLLGIYASPRLALLWPGLFFIFGCWGFMLFRARPCFGQDCAS